MEIGLSRFDAIREDLDRLQARNSHELMRALEVHAIRDCAEMAARASLYRTESRWGLYHNRIDYPERNDKDWFVHAQIQKINGQMTSFKRAIEPYIVPLDEEEKTAYQRLRIKKDPSDGQSGAPANAQHAAIV
jgi:succinate dehydrogenase/fumarate reductase flavoprotein subunit